MEVNLLHTKIEYMKGVGARRAELLHKELNIYTYQTTQIGRASCRERV